MNAIWSPILHLHDGWISPASHHTHTHTRIQFTVFMRREIIDTMQHFALSKRLLFPPIAKHTGCPKHAKNIKSLFLSTCRFQRHPVKNVSSHFFKTQRVRNREGEKCLSDARLLQALVSQMILAEHLLYMRIHNNKMKMLELTDRKQYASICFAPWIFRNTLIHAIIVHRNTEYGQFHVRFI